MAPARPGIRNVINVDARAVKYPPLWAALAGILVAVVAAHNRYSVATQGLRAASCI